MRYRPRRTAKERALAEWRGYWEPQDLSKFEHTITDVVEQTMKGLGLNKRFKEEEVFEAWNALVDPFVASNSRPISMERKVLYIQVLHSTVHYELERMKRLILKKMQDRFGADQIREIRFRLG